MSLFLLVLKRSGSLPAMEFLSQKVKEQKRDAAYYLKEGKACEKRTKGSELRVTEHKYKDWTSCKCQKGCKTKVCPCRKEKNACGDHCGCADSCVNNEKTEVVPIAGEMLPR